MSYVYALEDIRNYALKLEKLNDDQLASIAFPAIEGYLTGEGYASGNPRERIRYWVKDKLPKLCTLATEEAKDLRNALNDDRIRGDMTLVAIVAAALVKLLGLQGIPIEEITALALLIVRYYKGLHESKT